MKRGCLALSALLVSCGLSMPAHAEGQKIDSRASASYSSSDAEGGMSLDQIRAMPTDVAPFPVQLKVDGGKYLKVRPKIMVPSYGVAYIVSAEARASGAGSGSSMVNRAIRYNTALVGIDEAAMRLWANEAHADLVTRLTEAGFDVVAPDALRADPDYAKVKLTEGNRTQDAQIIDGRAKKGWIVFGADAAPLIKGMSLETGLGALAAGGSLGAIQNAGVDQDATTFHPMLVLDYIGIESSGQKLYSGRASISAETNFGIHPRSKVDFAYKIKRMGGTGYPGWFTIPDGYSSGEPFGVLREVDDKSDNLALHGAMALLGLSNSYTQRKVLAVEAVPERYGALVRAAYQGYNQAIVDGIVAARSGG
ncbi:MAG: hypothetical protein AB7O49_13895 [Sphingomonadales bacterium]